MNFIFSTDIQTFTFVQCIFKTHQYLGIFCTMLHNSSRSPIWYNISQHQYKHKCELPHPRGFLIIPCRIKFSFSRQVEKRQVYYFQALWFQMIDTQKLKFKGVLVAEVNIKILWSKAVEIGWKYNYKRVFQ
jgi:hypothetical protein